MEGYVSNKQLLHMQPRDERFHSIWLFLKFWFLLLQISMLDSPAVESTENTTSITDSFPALNSSEQEERTR